MNYLKRHDVNLPSLRQLLKYLHCIVLIVYECLCVEASLTKVIVILICLLPLCWFMHRCKSLYCWMCVCVYASISVCVCVCVEMSAQTEYDRAWHRWPSCHPQLLPQLDTGWSSQRERERKSEPVVGMKRGAVTGAEGDGRLILLHWSTNTFSNMRENNTLDSEGRSQISDGSHMKLCHWLVNSPLLLASWKASWGSSW